MAKERYFHVSYQTRGAVGFKTFASDRFPSMDEIAKDAGVSPENIVVTGIYEFNGIDDFEAFTGKLQTEEVADALPQ